MGKVQLFALLFLTLVLCFDDFSPEMQEMIARQRKTIARIDEIKATAVKDDQGKVSPEEYGRLLTLMVEATGGYKSLKDLPELLEGYIKTLEGPQDPEELLMDLGMGKFSQVMMEALNRDMKTAMKRDL
jgi:hypothetical protein